MGEYLGGFLWCWARLEGHVAQHQISGPPVWAACFSIDAMVRFSWLELLCPSESLMTKNKFLF